MWFNSGVSWICLQQWWSWQWWVCQESVFPQVWKCLHHWIKCTEDYSWPSLQTKHLTTSINCLIILIKYKMYLYQKKMILFLQQWFSGIYTQLRWDNSSQLKHDEKYLSVKLSRYCCIPCISDATTQHHLLQSLVNCLVKVNFSERITWMSTFSRKSCQWKHLIFLKNSLILCFRQCYTM